jgi:hypothetical protein
MWVLIEACMELPSPPAHPSHPFALLKVLLEAGARFVMPFGPNDEMSRNALLEANPLALVPPAVNCEFATASQHGNRISNKEFHTSLYHLADVPYVLANLVIVTDPMPFERAYRWMDLRAMGMQERPSQVFKSSAATWWSILTIVLQLLTQPRVDPLNATANVTTVLSEYKQLSVVKYPGFSPMDGTYETNINSTKTWRAFALHAQEEQYAHIQSKFIPFFERLGKCAVPGIVSAGLKYVSLAGIEALPTNADVRKNRMEKRCNVLESLFLRMESYRTFETSVFCRVLRGILSAPVADSAPSSNVKVIARIHDILDKFLHEKCNTRFRLPLEQWRAICMCAAEVASSSWMWVERWNSNHYDAWANSDRPHVHVLIQICQGRAQWVQALKDGTASPTPDMVHILRELTENGMAASLQAIVLSDYLEQPADDDDNGSKPRGAASSSSQSAERPFPFRFYTERMVYRWHVDNPAPAR